MDPVSLAFYAVICGTLGGAAPWLGRLPARLAVGAAVGIVAALLLPVLRGLAGY